MPSGLYKDADAWKTNSRDIQGPYMIGIEEAKVVRMQLAYVEVVFPQRYAVECHSRTRRGWDTCRPGLVECVDVLAKDIQCIVFGQESRKESRR
jgi:hypothetical protein